MADTALLFFLGLAGVVAISRFAAWLYPPRQIWVLPAGATLTILWLAAALVMLAAIVAFPTLGYFRTYGWTLLRSAALGCWIAFLAGCAAGFVVAAAVNAISIWGAWSESRTNILILAAGPGLTVLLLYMLSMPGITQKLGLTDIKAGEFEIALSPSQTANIPTDIPSFTPPQATLGNLSDEYSPWFQNIWPMFVDPKEPDKAAHFVDLTYFQKQNLYLRYDHYTGLVSESTDHLQVPLTASLEKQHPPGDIAKTVWSQQQFIRSLRPLVGCGAFYHLSFPDVPTLRPRLSRILEILVGIEIELEASAGSAQSTPDPEWVNIALVRLQTKAADFITHFRAAIPPSHKDPDDTDAPRWSDCNPKLPKSKLDISLPEVSGIALEPPYLAILIANIYGALGEKNVGLRILNSWINYYNRLKRPDPDPTRWLYDEAVWQYGVVQEADEVLPTTTSERKYLERMKKIFDRDWAIDLHNSGYDCGDTNVRMNLEARHRSFDKLDHTAAFSDGVETRLVLVYSNLLQRLLYATLQTLPSLDQDYLTPENEDWARQLVASSTRCLLDEKAESQNYRQALDGLF